MHRLSLSEQVAIAIRDAVLAGLYAPGSLLPTEPELARRFGVSRPVIREAVRILATQGLLRSEHGRGVVVLAPSVKPLFEGLTLAASRSHTPARELWETRRLLDLALVEPTIANCQEADISRMRAAVVSMRECLASSGEHNVDADVEFHHAFTSAAHNDFLASVIEPVTLLYRWVAHSLEARTMQREVRGLPRSHWFPHTCAAHERILDALADRDGPRLEAAVREHYELSIDMWGSHLETTLNELVISSSALRLTQPSVG